MTGRDALADHAEKGHHPVSDARHEVHAARLDGHDDRLDRHRADINALKQHAGLDGDDPVAGPDDHNDDEGSG